MLELNRAGIVTGGGAGIGRETALRFAAAGAGVVVADRSEDGGRETVQLITRAGGEADFVHADVTNEPDVEGMVDFAVQRFGRLDFAHNNAGGMPSAVDARQLLTTRADEWDTVLALNLRSAFLCLKHEIAYMVEHGGGAIVNTASAAAYRGGRAPASYTAAKHGLVGLTKSVALEFARRNVRVNAVCPGTVATDAVFERQGADDMRRRGETMPLGRLLTPSEIAEVVVWLCSDGASAFVGAVVSADGGLSAE